MTHCQSICIGQYVQIFLQEQVLGILTINTHTTTSSSLLIIIKLIINHCYCTQVQELWCKCSHHTSLSNHHTGIMGCPLMTWCHTHDHGNLSTVCEVGMKGWIQVCVDWLVYLCYEIIIASVCDAK